MNPHAPKILTNVDYRPEQVTPLYDRLLVRRIKDDDSVPIIDPKVVVAKSGEWRTKADTGPRRGVVVAAGLGDKSKKHHHKRILMDVKVGDTIIYPRFESTHVMLDGQEYTFVNESDVMAVLE